jgi:hypothetical protein
MQADSSNKKNTNACQPNLDVNNTLDDLQPNPDFTSE